MSRSVGKYLRFHFFYDCLRFIGMRDRLRCPSCHSVGTWKPHGGVLDKGDVRKVKRWLCKWCGFYLGPEGSLVCGMGAKSWMLPHELAVVTTPKGMVEGVYGFDRKVDPWRG